MRTDLAGPRPAPVPRADDVCHQIGQLPDIHACSSGDPVRFALLGIM
jgi:hypothetical protein